MSKISLKSISRSFLASTFSTAASSAVTLLTTVVIIRTLGSAAYADQMIDLAMLSIIVLLMELLPSSLSVFRVQEESSWRPIVSWHLIISATLSTILVSAIVAVDGILNTSSYFIVMYALSMFAKRHNDILLQAAGKVHILFLIDLIAAMLRLIAFCALLSHFSSDTVIWASLGVSSLVSYSAGLYYVARKFPDAERMLSAAHVSTVWSSRGEIAKYYPNIIIKRLSDVSITLIASQFFRTSEGLATFLLAYRGVTFSNVFSRIFESLLNNRLYISHVKARETIIVPVLAALSQIAAAASSFLLLLSAGMGVDEYGAVIVLSMISWPMVYTSFRRAGHYSTYSTRVITLSYLSYLVAIGVSASAAHALGFESVTAYSLCILIGYIVMARTMR